MTGRPFRVSVVIPLFNKVRYIRRSLDSVLLQTVRDFEVVVVDDGSTDGSGDVVREFIDPRVRLISQQNGGVSAARNLGIAEAGSELIAFLDADDEWLPNFLDTILTLCTSFPEAAAYGTGYRLMKSPLHAYRDIALRGSEAECGCYFDLSKKGGSVNSSAIVVRRPILRELGGFRVGHAKAEDLDMWFRIATRFSFAISPRICSVYNYCVPDNVQHSSVPRTGRNPVAIAFLEMRKDTEIDANIQAKATAYAARTVAREILTRFRDATLSIRRDNLREYCSVFGANRYYLWLLVMGILPKCFLRFHTHMRLRIVGATLKMRGVLRDVLLRVGTQ